MLLATRAAFNDQAYMRDYLGSTTADLAHRTARSSTSLVDTATDYWALRSVSSEGLMFRRMRRFSTCSRDSAYDAGLGPHMTILAVDGRAYSPEVLNESIEHPRNRKITLIVRNFDSVETREIQYAGASATHIWKGFQILTIT